MKTIMISVKPEYADLEMNGIKRIEVRKFYIEPPFKVVNYVCLGKKKDIKVSDTSILGCPIYKRTHEGIGKVVFEYVVNKVDNLFALSRFWVDESNVAKSCLTSEEMRKYANGKEYIYGFHISDLKIYDTPKELSEFFVKGECSYEDYSLCCRCKNFHRGRGWLDGSYCDEDDCVTYGIKPLIRPPQSWCYVEEVEE